MARLCVRDLMTAEVVTISASADLATARDLFDDRRIRHLPVTEEDGTLVGLMSHTDLLRSAMSDRSEVTLSMQEALLRRMQVRDIMTTSVETVEADTPIEAAAAVMLEGKYGCLPVVEGEFLVGILTQSDFVRYVADTNSST